MVQQFLWMGRKAEVFKMSKRILVCGATGLVGTNMLVRLRDDPDFHIRAVHRKKKPKIFSNNIYYEEADLTVFDDCKRLVEDIDYVLMFAAKIERRSTNQEYIISNLIMNSQLLEAAYNAGVEKFLWLSSATAYPPSEEPLREDKMFDGDPHDVYFPLGWMTRYIEILCRMYAEKLKRHMTAIVLRPTAIYGRYDDFNSHTSHVLAALIRKVAERQSPIEVWGTGEVKRDFIYVDDVVDACLLALEKVSGFDVFNIGLGNSYSVKELLEIILEVDGFSQAKILYDKSKQVTSPIIAVDCNKAKEAIGFEAKTTIREGIGKTIEWYRNNTMSHIGQS